MSLHLPVRSKFSRENPIGSMILWHEAQLGLERCSSIRSRMESTLPSVRSLFSFNGGTLAGTAGAETPKIFSRIHLPRLTGEVRFPADVTRRKLALPRSPHRGSSFSNVTRRK